MDEQLSINQAEKTSNRFLKGPAGQDPQEMPYDCRNCSCRDGHEFSATADVPPPATSTYGKPSRPMLGVMVRSGLANAADSACAACFATSEVVSMSPSSDAVRAR